ncbi:hypothetical protein ACIQXD_28145 [Streptomyces uncialis]|uniref:hypothetical protein n=1 Tax=Streptomyces uncialis TaxID=1048205 RepID=UPI00382053C6
MPGTVVERVTGPVAAGVVPAVFDAAGLTSSERTVALYASDMPTRRRYGTKEQVRAWIAQGVERLGHEEVARRAVFCYGHRLLELSNLVPAAVRAAHEARFPDAFRLDVAAQATATSICFDGMHEAARKRNGAARVDGPCPCRGTGSIRLWVYGDGMFSLVCPVHNGGGRA